MNIIKHGQKVVTNLSNIEGIITATIIRFESIVYEISYFNNNEYKQIWLTEFEFDVKNLDRKKIGLK